MGKNPKWLWTMAFLALSSRTFAWEDISFLKELVAIPSVSSDIAKCNEAVDFVNARIAEEGLFSSVVTNGEGRAVLYASTMETKVPDVLVSVHLDVVPPSVEGQFVAREKDGFLYGRGMSDCKEHATLALRLMSDLRDRVSLGVLFATDEEIGGFTTAFMLSQGCAARKLIVVLDADQYGITVEEKGIAIYRVVVRGESGHLDKTGGLGNSVERLIEGFERVRKVCQAPSNPAEWCDTIVPVSFHAGDAALRTPKSAEMHIKVLYRTEGDSQRYLKLIREKIGGEVSLVRDCRPVKIDGDHPLVRDMYERMVCAWPDRVIRRYRLNGATDARHMTGMNLPMLLIGMDASGAHSAEERLRIASYEEYRKLLEKYLLDHFGRKGKDS